MDRLKLTHESRCLVILAGGVLEQRIENRARGIANSRSAAEIVPEDVKKATTEFLRKELFDLPRLIEEAISSYEHRSNEAA